MDACSVIGESTDAIVMDDSPEDEREIQEACQRWVFLFPPMPISLVVRGMIITGR